MPQHKQLLQDSRRYASENRATSWWCLLSTAAAYFACMAVIVLFDSLLLRLAASIIAGLVIVRLFILYHDYLHDSILKGSPVAKWFMIFYGLLTLNPPSIWRRSHNHHHRHNAKLRTSSIGSFPLMTIGEYQAASPRQRFIYLASRHPLVFPFAYLTIFMFGMCIRSLLANPRAHADSALAIFVHLLTLGIIALYGLDLLLLCMILPNAISAMVGGYLFYAQHNFPAARFREAEDWSYVDAALQSSSYLKMHPIMEWFTGNIGYHHVHHLNHKIPFYRLPEAMRGLPALQSPGTTTLRPADILACLRLKVWDPESEQLIPAPRSETFVFGWRAAT